MHACLWVALATAATIEEPRWGEPFASGAVVERANDVFAVGEAVPIEIVGLDPAEACVLTAPDGEEVYDAAHPACSPADDGSLACVDALAADVAGGWVLTCPGDEVGFWVADVHERLWLPAGGGAQLLEEFVTVDLVAGCDDENTADPWSNPDPTWVRACAWSYLLNQSLGVYAREPGVAITRFSWRDWPQPSAIDEPAAVLASADARPYGNVLERLALAWLVARHDPDGAVFGELEAEYADAVRYWGGHLVDHWDEASLDDLEHSRLLVALAAAYDWAWPALSLDERRAWRDHLARETAELVASSAPLLPQPYVKRRQIRNPHFWERNGAIAVAAYVLDSELAYADAPAAWRQQAEGFHDALLDELGAAGDHNGVFYGAYEWALLLRTLDAAALVDAPLADAVDEPWVRALPEGFAHMTLPNGQRAAFADGVPQDADKPSWIFARLANEPGGAGPLAQRLAWQGHNRWTYTNNRRDVMDVLWWDATLPALQDDGFAARGRHACFGGTGTGSLRTGWGPDDTHLLYVGGPLFGGHDDPAVGTFLLYAQGHLVGGDDLNNVAKRTALHSTLLVDGKGQHGDFAAFTVSPPENRAGTTENNDSWLVAWLDGSGPAGATNVDVVGFGSDLTQLYRYDPDHDDPLRIDPNDWPRWFTTVEDDRKKLDSLRRYVVWLDGRVFVYDRFETSGRGATRFDTLLAIGATDAAERGVLCPISAHQQGFAQYRDGKGGTIGVRLAAYGTTAWCDHPNEFPCVACVPGTAACPTNVDLATQLNRGEWQPVLGACPSPAGVSGTVATIDPSVGGSAGAGRLRVVALDGIPWAVQPSPWLDGQRTRGHRLSRTRTASDGYFLAELTPYTGSPPPPATATPVDGGLVVQAGLGDHDATLLFDNATRTSVSEGGKTGSQLVGHVGVVLHDASGPIAAQALHATRLLYRKQLLIETSIRASASVNWGREVTWGRVEEVSGPVDVWIWTNGRTPGLLTIETAAGTTATVPSVDRSGGVTFRVTGPATFRLVSGQDDGSRPGSVCR